MDENNRLNHNIILEDRKRFNLSGIKDVLTFDEETVLLDTNLGRLSIKGDGLRISNFNNETGDLTGEGKIFAIIYSSQESQGGFFAKLLR